MLIYCVKLRYTRLDYKGSVSWSAKRSSLLQKSKKMKGKSLPISLLWTLWRIFDAKIPSVQTVEPIQSYKTFYYCKLECLLPTS